MSIRLRLVDGQRLALCGYETDEEPGDVYLDDAQHRALADKFADDFTESCIYDPGDDYRRRRDSQRLRDASTREDLQ